ncbi:MAG: hypothetical protein HKN27_07935 [Silicimonas sp.]|nr:hypothetical protein [Silicimonas sp.]
MSNAPLVERMLNAAMDRSDETLRAAADNMLELGIPAEVIVDDIIPKTARTMGEEWVQDISSFASVTLGASRLQTLVRELAAKWSADNAASARSAVLLWVPQAAQHTLGATVVSTQLRRRGHSVQFSPGGGLPEFSRALTEGNYDGVIISASMSDSTDEVRNVVDAAKAHQSDLPVIIGGTILKQHDDLPRLTGADFATNDLDKATAAFSAAR